MDGNWHCHQNTNSFEGFGVPQHGMIDNDASSLKGVSLTTCQEWCLGRPDCGCVVHYTCPLALGFWQNCAHGLVDGQCWRRTYCDYSTSKTNDEGFQMCNINLG
jgi:hypothetical protein